LKNPHIGGKKAAGSHAPAAMMGKINIFLFMRHDMDISVDNVCSQVFPDWK